MVLEKQLLGLLLVVPEHLGPLQLREEDLGRLVVLGENLLGVRKLLLQLLEVLPEEDLGRLVPGVLQLLLEGQLGALVLAENLGPWVLALWVLEVPTRFLLQQPLAWCWE